MDECDKYPEEFNEDFFREVQYCLNLERFNGWKREQEKYRDEKVKFAEEANLWKICFICCDEKLIEDDMLTCTKEEHEFCKHCVIAHAIAQFGEGASSIKCMSDACSDGFYSLAVLKQVLEPKIFLSLSRRNQQAEIMAADLDNVESCPFCEYAVVIENRENTVFKCLNPDCSRDSCRLCHEEEHLPYRCDEVEKDFETQRRKYVEECMAEAVIRKCPKCKQSITKESGCNKMTCTCGCFFCYVCNKELSRADPYRHFSAFKCAQETSLQQLHAQAAKMAGKKALSEFNRRNPELSKRFDKVPDVNMLAEDSVTRKRRRT